MTKIRLFILCIIVLAFGICFTSPAMGESISITADRDSIYLGDIITFKGNNSGSDTLYLFIAGPNLPSSGSNLTDPMTGVVFDDISTFTSTYVRENNTWEYQWQTSNLSLDAGNYTIYAVATPSDKDNITSTYYATITLTIGNSFYSSDTSGDMIEEGYSDNEVKTDYVTVTADPRVRNTPIHPYGNTASPVYPERIRNSPIHPYGTRTSPVYPDRNHNPSDSPPDNDNNPSHTYEGIYVPGNNLG